MYHFAQSSVHFVKKLQKKWKLDFSQEKIRQFVQNGQGRERVKIAEKCDKKCV
jgi:hypothetical protein